MTHLRRFFLRFEENLAALCLSGLLVTLFLQVFTRFITREHMLASGEMQISGEPLAEQMGRDLGGFSRDLLPTDIYVDPVVGLYWIDLAGFSTGVE